MSDTVDHLRATVRTTRYMLVFRDGRCALDGGYGDAVGALREEPDAIRADLYDYDREEFLGSLTPAPGGPEFRGPS